MTPSVARVLLLHHCNLQLQPNGLADLDHILELHVLELRILLITVVALGDPCLLGDGSLVDAGRIPLDYHQLSQPIQPKKRPEVPRLCVTTLSQELYTDVQIIQDVLRDFLPLLDERTSERFDLREFLMDLFLLFFL